MNSGQLNVHKPAAVGLVRPDVSGLQAPHHAVLIQRHAEQLGYRYVYTVRPPLDNADPIGYALGLAAGLNAAALVVYDLETVGNMPARVCEMFDLETVNPPETWVASLRGAVDPGHGYPNQPLTVIAAQRIMQHHLTCRAAACPRKSSAYRCLAEAGKIVPPLTTPRERAAARGLPYPPEAVSRVRLSGVSIPTLLDVLGGLVDAR